MFQYKNLNLDPPEPVYEQGAIPQIPMFPTLLQGAEKQKQENLENSQSKPGKYRGKATERSCLKKVESEKLHNSYPLTL